MNENTEPEIVEMNTPDTNAAASTPNAPKRAWFEDEQGFTGDAIEYGGQKFFAREVPKSGLRQFSRDTQRVQQETKVLARQQENEIKALRKDAVAPDDVELPNERNEFYENESERLMDELDTAYNSLLEKGIVDWDLPRPFSADLLFKLSKVDRVALCQAIGSRSTSGFEAVKNSPGRLKR